jgi:integrase
VEALRAASEPRDATLLSVLAYAGLRPQEAIALCWGHVRDRTLLIERAASLGELRDTKTHAHRTVRLLRPLIGDLALWRGLSAPPPPETLIFPTSKGGLWTGEDWRNWRHRAFDRAVKAVGLERVRPYDLRHSFASLLLHEGRSMMYVARQLGHDAQLTLSTYGHVIDELDDAPRIAAEDAIRAARDARVSPVCNGGPADA